MTIRVNYEHELALLREDIQEMGRLVEQAIEQVFSAFERQDCAAAEEIIKGDRTVNDMERAIEARCLSLILKQQPVAGDLRTVTAALKVVTDLERIGDHASDIAELILRIQGEHIYYIVRHLPPMAEKAREMVRGSIEAFISQDLAAAKSVGLQDDQVDELFGKVKEEVARLLKSGRDISDQCIDLLMIAKYFERIGDHAVNVCEWTEFSRTGALKQVRIF